MILNHSLYGGTSGGLNLVCYSTLWSDIFAAVRMFVVDVIKEQCYAKGDCGRLQMRTNNENDGDLC